jgi:Type III flagellar switch regulator (C-ring) FliN C-term
MLGFGRRCDVVGGRRIRGISFEERSMLPVSVACVVACSVRETLAKLFGEAVILKLYEPTIPQPSAWNAIVRDATVYRVQAASIAAAVIVRAADASALAAAAFGERDARASVLSTLERTVLERIIRAIATQFGPICGTAAELALDVPLDVRALRTFFELQVEHPVRARIGIALSRDPLPEAQPGVALDDLRDLEVELAVQVEIGRHTAADVGALEPGVILPLPAGAPRGTLLLAGRPLAVGECGVHGRYYAIAVDRTPGERDDPER